eukprot:6073867-Ditylum_brightwellii.AAC.1
MGGPVPPPPPPIHQNVPTGSNLQEVNVGAGSGGVARNNDADVSSSEAGEGLIREVQYQRTPRTMLDLIRMNAAAKIAQWGEENDGNAGGAATASDDESGTDSASDDDSMSDTESDDYDEDSFSLLYSNFHKRSTSRDAY